MNIDVPANGATVGGWFLRGSPPDVGAAFGSQFAPSGFNLGVTRPPGQYWLVAYPFSSVSQTFVKEPVILINVQ